MKLTHPRHIARPIVAIACWVSLFAFGAINRADDAPAADKPAAPATEQPAVKWRPLFDGKTLKNWKSTEYGGEGDVLVEEGQIIVEAGEPLSGITWTGGDLPKSNYEVQLEARKVEGSDFFLALTFPVKESHCSLVLGGWGGGVTGLSSINGFDASENETTDYNDYPRGQWFKVRVRVTDGAIQAWLDDERIVNVETEGNRFSLRIEVDQNRPLGMATFMTKAAYKNIQIRELGKETAKDAIDQPTKE